MHHMCIPTLIAEHDPVSRDTLVELLARDTDVELVGQCEDAESALEAVGRLAPNLVFLDADLPGRDSFDVATSLAGERRLPLLVFLADHDGQARRAFDVHALDYLVKPLEPERVRATLERAREQLSSLDARRRERVLVKTDGRVLLLHRHEIDWVETAGNYLTLHVGSLTHMVRQTMAQMERDLGGDRFVRIHRSHLVNVDRIVEFCPLLDGDYTVVLRSGARLTLSRGYRDRVQQYLGRSF